MARIGMVGLGAMGGPMARNLIKAGHELKVYDTVAAAVDAVAAVGAQPAKHDTVAHDVEVVVTMLRHGGDVIDVLAGKKGLFEHAAENTLFIDASTIDVKTARTLSTWATTAGMAMVDAPVSGGVAGAKAATLTFMVGGEEKSFSRAKPILAAMGEAIVHVGKPGSGQVAKICNNMILGVSVIAVAEAFRLAAKLGLDAEILQEIVSQSSGNCWVLNHNHPVPGIVSSSPANDEYRPGFSSALMLKDLQLGQHAAQDCGASTPLGAKATELYEEFVREGNAGLDFGAIINKLKASERLQ